MNPELASLLARIADLPDFAGVPVENVAVRNSVGDTPLHVVAIWGDVNSGEILLKAGADLNARGEHGYTPLHEAVEQEQMEFARFLLGHGASKSLKNDYGLTPADLAAQSDNSGLTQLFK